MPSEFSWSAIHRRLHLQRIYPQRLRSSSRRSVALRYQAVDAGTLTEAVWRFSHVRVFSMSFCHPLDLIASALPHMSSWRDRAAFLGSGNSEEASDPHGVIRSMTQSYTEMKLMENAEAGEVNASDSSKDQG